jgi:hypothetical protein
VKARSNFTKRLLAFDIISGEPAYRRFSVIFSLSI